MKQSFTFILACVAQLGSSCVLVAQDAPATAKAPEPAKSLAPRIQFSETTFNFGKIKPTDPAKHEFIVTNTGTALLEITAVQPGCGCTTAGAWDKQIEPGKTGKIPIQFNPANFFGTVSKGVTVTCNDPVQGTHYLQIQATIWRPIDAQPQYLHFMPVEGEETNETKVIRITNNTDDPVTVETPSSSSPVFKTEIKEIRPGKEFELQVTYVGPVSNASPQANITINTSLTNTQPLNVTAFAMTQPAISAMPQFIQLPPGPYSPGYQYPVTIRNNSRTPIKVSDAAVNTDEITVQMQEVEPGKTFRVNLGIPSTFHVIPSQPTELTLKTTHPKHPVLKVPITQMAPPNPAPVVKSPQAITPAPGPLISSPPAPVVGPVRPPAAAK